MSSAISNPASPDRRMSVFHRVAHCPLRMKGCRVLGERDHLLYAGIEREVIIMGQGPRFELWSPERLHPVLQQNFDSVAGDLADSGIDFGF